MKTTTKRKRRPQTPRPPRKRGRPISIDSGAIGTSVPLRLKEQLVEEAEALDLSLGGYLARVLLGLLREERMSAARIELPLGGDEC